MLKDQNSAAIFSVSMPVFLRGPSLGIWSQICRSQYFPPTPCPLKQHKSIFQDSKWHWITNLLGVRWTRTAHQTLFCFWWPSTFQIRHSTSLNHPEQALQTMAFCSMRSLGLVPYTTRSPSNKLRAIRSFLLMRSSWRGTAEHGLSAARMPKRETYPPVSFFRAVCNRVSKRWI